MAATKGRSVLEETPWPIKKENYELNEVIGEYSQCFFTADCCKKMLLSVIKIDKKVSTTAVMLLLNLHFKGKVSPVSLVQSGVHVTTNNKPVIRYKVLKVL